MKTIQEIANRFIVDMTAVITADVREQAMKHISNGRTSPSKKSSSNGFAEAAASTKAKRRKGPIQLCPVPGCKERAAPVFGMVCGKHRSLPKATIKKFREARRAKNKPGKK